MKTMMRVVLVSFTLGSAVLGGHHLFASGSADATQLSATCAPAACDAKCDPTDCPPECRPEACAKP